jgi:hypothetical protein
MDFVEGRVLWDQSLPGMSRAERGAIWDELNRVIARLHSINFEEIGLQTFGKPGSYIERQVARWSKQYEASETEPMEAMNNLIAWLPKNIPPETGTSVVHGDFRLDNAIFHPTEPKILAVLDWELSNGSATARRLRLPLHELAHPARDSSSGNRRLDPANSEFRRERYVGVLRTNRSKRDRPAHWDSSWPTTCSASPRSCRASEARGRRHGGERARGDAGSRREAMAELGWKIRKSRKFWESSVNFDYRRRSGAAQASAHSCRASIPTSTSGSARAKRQALGAGAGDRGAEGQGAPGRPVEPVAARSRTAARSPTSSTRRSARSWAACTGRRRSSTARRPTPATWRRC